MAETAKMRKMRKQSAVVREECEECRQVFACQMTLAAHVVDCHVDSAPNAKRAKIEVVSPTNQQLPLAPPTNQQPPPTACRPISERMTLFECPMCDVRATHDAIIRRHMMMDHGAMEVKCEGYALTPIVFDVKLVEEKAGKEIDGEDVVEKTTETENIVETTPAADVTIYDAESTPAVEMKPRRTPTQHCPVCESKVVNRLQHMRKVHKLDDAAIKAHIRATAVDQTTLSAVTADQSAPSTTDAPPSCRFCGVQISTRMSLERHIRLRHPKMVAMTASLTEGERQDVKERTCKFCNKLMSTIPNLRRHERTVHDMHIEGEEETKEKSPTTQRDSETTVEEEDFIVAPADVVDDKKKFTICETPRHSEFVEEETIVPPSSESEHPCTLCASTFSKYGRLRSHLITVHQLSVPLLHPKRSNRKPRVYDEEYYAARTHRCEECLEAFRRRPELNKHVALTHVPLADCAELLPTMHSRRSPNYKPRAYDTHYYAKRPFKCVECPIAAISTHALRCHVSRYHPRAFVFDAVYYARRPFKCVECSRASTTAAKLEEHVARYHCEEEEMYNEEYYNHRPYRCDLCRKASINASALQSHKRTYHASKTAATNDVDAPTTHGVEVDPPTTEGAIDGAVVEVEEEPAASPSIVDYYSDISE